MKLKLIGTAIFEAEIPDETLNQKDFDLSAWAEQEFNRQYVAFSPDECIYKEYIIDEKQK